VVTRSKSNKELGTLHSRQKKFIKCLTEVKLPLNLTLNQLKQKHRKNVLAYYTAHFAMSNTLLFCSIRAETIVKYLNAVAIFSIPQGLQNPTHDQYDNRA